MKKILCIILSILILTSVFSSLNVSVFAEETEDEIITDEIDYASLYPYDSTTGYYYEICDNGTIADDTDDYIEVKKYAGTATSLTIPASIKASDGVTYSVISLGPDTYKNNTSITKITLGAALEEIDPEAFSGCTALKTFAKNSSNSKFNVQTSTSSGYNYQITQNNNTELVAFPPARTSITIYSSIKTILPKAFYNHTTLKTVTFKSSSTIKTIGDDAFYGCESLTSIDIKTTTSIGARAFANCYALKTVSRSSNLVDLGDGAFDGCSALSSFSLTTSDSITAIGDATFRSCESFSSFSIPSTIKSIGNNAFEGCMGLTSITVPSSVTSLGSYAFAQCAQLESISIPNQFTTISEGLFDGCEALADYTISSKITTIEPRAFAGCATFSKITIPNTVKTIGDGAFEGCGGATSLSIGTGITEISAGAFAYCSGLTSVTVPANVKVIGDYAFGGCEFLTTITLKEGLQTIGTEAFSTCDLLTSLNIPASVTSIGAGVCSLCSSLSTLTVSSSNAYYTASGNILYNKNKTEMIFYPAKLSSTSYTIPSTVTKIADSCFAGNTNLTKVTIGDSVKEIGANAFRTCESLETVSVSSSVTRVGTDAFTDTLWYINKETDLYEAGGGLMYIGKVLYTYVGETAPKSLSISSGTTRIEENALSYLVGYDEDAEKEFGLTSITIPSSVKSIGSNAFNGCIFLKTITGATGLTEIGSNAFANCTSLPSITLPSTLTKIGDQAFYGCTLFTSLTIPASVTSIGNTILQECPNVTAINVSASNTAYSSSNGVLFDKNMTTLIQYPIANSATSYEIPNKVTTIKAGAFSGVQKLTSVTIPATVIEFGTIIYTDPDGTTVSKPDTFLDEANPITIHGYEDTPAHTYALENGLKFVALVVTGQFVTENGQIKYFYSNNKYAYGWLDVNNATYYFDENGCAAIGYYLVDTIVYNFASTGAKTETCGPLGDSNVDGGVNIKDVTNTQKMVANITAKNDKNSALTDVDGDARITVRDATNLQLYLAKSISKLPRQK